MIIFTLQPLSPPGTYGIEVFSRTTQRIAVSKLLSFFGLSPSFGILKKLVFSYSQTASVV
jgi:hypothetical protein